MDTNYVEQHAEWVRLNSVKKGDRMRVLVRPTNHQSGWHCSLPVPDGIQPGVEVTVKLPIHGSPSCGLIVYEFNSAHLPFFCLVKL